MEVKGTVKAVYETIQVSEKFLKRDVVITDASGMYPQDILFQFTQDKCDLLNGINLNDEITVHFNLRGREWTSPQGETKYFNTLEGWRIDKGTKVSQPIKSDGIVDNFKEEAIQSMDMGGDLPF
jgi:hypothetical protein